MKKLFAMAIVALASAFGAQAENLYVGGEVGFMHDGDKNTNALSILPEIGYNLNSHWAVGTTIGWQYTHFCGRDLSTNLFRFNPYARYTFFRSSNNLVNLFVDGTVGVGLGWTSYKDDDTDAACVWEIGLKPGIAINLTDKFSIVAHVGMLGYQGVNDAAKPAYHSKGGLDLSGNNLSFGFYYNF